MTVTTKDLKEESSRVTDKAEDEMAPFETAFQEHWSRVCGVTFRLVGDRAEAEDLALETFWRLYQRKPKSGENITGWLYRVATNLGLNALRARKRRSHYEGEAGRIEMPYSPDPARELEKSEERRQVRAALAQMRPKSARLLVLRYSGLSYAEMASVLGVPPGSIGTLLARAEKEFISHYQKNQGA